METSSTLLVIRDQETRETFVHNGYIYYGFKNRNTNSKDVHLLCALFYKNLCQFRAVFNNGKFSAAGKHICQHTHGRDINAIRLELLKLNVDGSLATIIKKDYIKSYRGNTGLSIIDTLTKEILGVEPDKTDVSSKLIKSNKGSNHASTSKGDGLKTPKNKSVRTSAKPVPYYRPILPKHPTISTTNQVNTSPPQQYKPYFYVPRNQNEVVGNQINNNANVPVIAPNVPRPHVLVEKPVANIWRPW